VVHLVDIFQDRQPQKPDSGVSSCAFVSRRFRRHEAAAAIQGMPFDGGRFRAADLWQIFVNDPNGVISKLNYEAPRSRRLGAHERADDVG